MTPRPAACDGPDCEPSAYGWLHYPDCAFVHAGPDPDPEDMAAATALEDGYSRPYGKATARTSTFGHEPIEFCGQTVCDRCGTIGELTPGYNVRDLVPWPCTSALVLGLVARQEAGVAS